MSFFREVEQHETFAPFVAFQEGLGFVPNLFRAQTLLPRVIEVQAHIAGTVLLKERSLSRTLKERILLAVAAAEQNVYCVTQHCQILCSLGVPAPQVDQLLSDYRRAGLSAAETALLDFALKLSREAPRLGQEDVETVRGQGFSDDAILEAILVTALARFLCTLSVGLGPDSDFEPRQVPPITITPQREAALRSFVSRDAHLPRGKGPYLRAADESPRIFPPFAFFQKSFGFIPNIFRAQTLWPEVLEAEAHAVGTILLTEDVLTRVEKECILLVVSAANLNSYCVAVHCEMLRGLGIPPEESDQVAVNHHQSSLSGADKALLDFALKLGMRPTEFRREDINLLRRQGLTDQQILEAVVMTALTNFLNTLQMGLGTVPDFEPRLVFGPEILDRSPVGTRPMPWSSIFSPAEKVTEDPDAPLVARVQAGGFEAFEELVRRHNRRVYRTLVGILGDPEEARDAMQDAFLKAFKHIGEFQGRSKFSTWLVSIARNAGVQLLRERKNLESLDQLGSQEDEEFCPQHVRAWRDNPEQLYAEVEMRGVVEKAVMRLPAEYRVVVMLRDIEQLPTEDAAQALGLSVPALKARLFRGRLMLRELLSPHFTEVAGRTGL